VRTPALVPAAELSIPRALRRRVDLHRAVIPGNRSQLLGMVTVRAIVIRPTRFAWLPRVTKRECTTDYLRNQGTCRAVAKPLMLRERGCIRRVRLMRGQSHWEQKSKGTAGVAGAVSAEFSVPRCSSTGILRAGGTANESVEPGNPNQPV